MAEPTTSTDIPAVPMTVPLNASGSANNPNDVLTSQSVQPTVKPPLYSGIQSSSSASSESFQLPPRLSRRLRWLWIVLALIVLFGATGAFALKLHIDRQFALNQSRQDEQQKQFDDFKKSAKISDLEVKNLYGDVATIRQLTITGSTNLDSLMAQTISTGDIQIDGDQTTSGSQTTAGNAVIDGNLLVRGATTTTDLRVSGSTTLAGLVSSGQLKLTGKQNDLVLIQPSQNNGQKVFTLRAPTGAELAALDASGNLNLAGNISVGGNSSIAGVLSVTGATSLTSLSADNTNLKEATIGILTVTSPAVFTGTPVGALVNQGVMYINPANANPTDTLLGLGVAGNQKLRVDASGNVYANNIILNGSVTSGDTTASNLTVISNTTLGTDATNTTTVNSTSNFNAPVTITAANPFTVGTGTTTLGGNLSLVGTANLQGNTVIGGTLTVAGATSLASLDVTGNITGSSSIQGTQLISTFATGTAPLVVASSTKVANLNVDLLDGLDSSDFAAAIGSGNYIQNGTALQAAANFNIQSASATSIGGIIRGAASQTADLLQLQNSAGTVLSKFDASGNLVVSATGDSSFAGKLGIGTSIPGAKLDVNSGNNQVGLRVGDTTLNRLVTIGYENASSIFAASSATATGFIAGTGAIDKFQVNDSLGIKGSSASTPVIILQSAASQTASMLKMQDANNAMLANFDANANLTSYGTNTNLLALATPAFTTASTGTAFYYVITATNAQGETVVSASLGMANATSTLNWTQVLGATGYKIYRNTTNSFTAGSLLRTTITNGTTVAFTDTGAATTAGLPPTAPTGTTLTLGGWSSQSGDLLSTNPGTKIRNNGSVRVFTSGNQANAFQVLNNGSGNIFNVNTTNGGAITINGVTSITSSTSGTNDALSVSNSTSTGNVAVFKDDTTTVLSIADGGATVFKNSSDSISAFQIQNAASSTVFGVDTTTGNVAIGAASSTARLYVQNAVATNVALVVRAAASQTANIQEWQNSAGTVLAKVDASGYVSGANLTTSDFGPVSWSKQTGLGYGAGSYSRITMISPTVVSVNVKLIASSADAGNWRLNLSGLPAPKNGATIVLPTNLQIGGGMYAWSLANDGGGTWFPLPDGGTIAVGYTGGIAVGDAIYINTTYEIQ